MVVDPRSWEQISAFLQQERQGVVATVTRHGRPEAALVGLGWSDDGSLIFNSRLDARKIDNLAANDLVAVVVGVGDVTVQLEGRATITADQEREQYGREYDRQFPGSRALDPAFAVVVVRPSWVRVYDTSTEPAVVAEASWPD